MGIWLRLKDSRRNTTAAGEWIKPRAALSETAAPPNTSLRNRQTPSSASASFAQYRQRASALSAAGSPAGSSARNNVESRSCPSSDASPIVPPVSRTSLLYLRYLAKISSRTLSRSSGSSSHQSATKRSSTTSFQMGSETSVVPSRFATHCLRASSVSTCELHIGHIVACQIWIVPRLQQRSAT